MTDGPLDGEVTMAPVKLGEIAATLESGAARFAAKAAHILAALDDTSTTNEHASFSYRAYAADPRNEPAQPVAERHDDAVAATRELLRSLGSGMSRLGGAIAAFGNDVSGRDTAMADQLRRTGDTAV